MYDRVYDDMIKYTIWLCGLYIPPVILSAAGLFVLAVLYVFFYMLLSVVIWKKYNKKLKI